MVKRNKKSSKVLMGLMAVAVASQTGSMVASAHAVDAGGHGSFEIVEFSVPWASEDVATWQGLSEAHREALQDRLSPLYFSAWDDFIGFNAPYADHPNIAQIRAIHGELSGGAFAQLNIWYTVNMSLPFEDEHNQTAVENIILATETINGFYNRLRNAIEATEAQDGFGESDADGQGGNGSGDGGTGTDEQGGGSGSGTGNVGQGGSGSGQGGTGGAGDTAHPGDIASGSGADIGAIGQGGNSSDDGGTGTDGEADGSSENEEDGADGEDGEITNPQTSTASIIANGTMLVTALGGAVATAKKKI